MMRASVLLLGAVALAAATPAPDTFKVVFETDVALGDGQIVLNVTKSLAPIGAQRVWDLVNAKFFDEAAFFRVVPKFVVQFGIAGNPAVEAQWINKDLKDDPVKASNLKGTLVFATAGPNTRTTQLFINYVDNTFLDSQGFAPFGVVTKGLDVAVAIFNPTPGNTGGIDQGSYETKGNTWLKAQYPKANFIKSAHTA
eukprot:Rhum_TRINITY_DN14932_c15_g1::Rhum_TRINITY_DN14932_c15_g1_i1::g.129780::m.129780